MKRIKLALKILAILPCLFFMLSCEIDNILRDPNKSSSILIVAKITGETADGTAADFFESDVEDDATSNVYEDVATASLQAKMKEPEAVLAPSLQNNILVTSYTVTYEDLDTPGGAVPNSFTGYMNSLIEIDSTVDVTFILVRSTAKNQTPLQELKNTANDLNVRATITFYGHDLAENPVEATSNITIHFADWVN